MKDLQGLVRQSLKFFMADFRKNIGKFDPPKNTFLRKTAHILPE